MIFDFSTWKSTRILNAESPFLVWEKNKAIYLYVCVFVCIDGCKRKGHCSSEMRFYCFHIEFSYDKHESITENGTQ